MTQMELERRIKDVFKEKYFDLGIYRWLNRNKKNLKLWFSISFVAVLSIAFMGQSWPLAFWAFAFIGTISLGGLDNFIISLSFRRILNKLESEKIHLTLPGLLKTCSEILPK
jgi:hypothetical protein